MRIVIWNCARRDYFEWALNMNIQNIASIQGIGGPELLIILVIGIVVAFCRIFRKAGYPWALGLLMFVPILNLILFFVLAFKRWPQERRIEDMELELQQFQSGTGQYLPDQ